MITIEEFSKINFIIGLVEDINKNNIRIKCNNKLFTININLKVQKGDKIAIIIAENKIIIPVVSQNIPLIPESEIEEGSRIR